MKKLICILISLLCISCTSKADYGEPIQAPSFILKNISNYLAYANNHIRYTEDFTALDENKKVIGKKQFFQKLINEKFLPLKLQSKKGLYYTLYKIKATGDEMIPGLIKSMAQLYYSYYKMEGTRLPKYNFKDLNGKIYNPVTTKGKIVVIKFWYIHCVMCVKEMPALNQMIDQYKNNKDLVFLSLAFDNEEKLKKFLKQRPFKYAVVPNTEKYADDFGIKSYPTHIILNKNGLISKVLSNSDELAIALKNEIVLHSKTD